MYLNFNSEARRQNTSLMVFFFFLYWKLQLDFKLCQMQSASVSDNCFLLNYVRASNNSQGCIMQRHKRDMLKLTFKKHPKVSLIRARRLKNSTRWKDRVREYPLKNCNGRWLVEGGVSHHSVFMICRVSFILNRFVWALKLSVNYTQSFLNTLHHSRPYL